MNTRLGKTNASKLESALETLPGAVLRLDRDMKLVAANKAWVRISGKSLRSSLHKALPDLVAEPFTNACRAYLATCLAGTARAEMVDIAFVGHGQKDAIFALRAEPLADGSGLACMLSDVSDRRRLEISYRRNEEAIRTLYAVTTSRHLNLSEKMQALLGMGCQHFKMDAGFLVRIDGGVACIEEVYDESGESAKGYTLPLEETFTREVLRAGGQVEILDTSAPQYAGRQAFSREKFVAYLGIPILAGSEVFGALCFASLKAKSNPASPAEMEFLRMLALWLGGEIEHTIQAEQLRHYAGEIERMNQALAFARDEALEADRAKSEFLATISHEIRTPINAIIGMTEFLLDSPLSKAQEDYARVVHESAQMLLSLINDILDYSKIEAGKLALECIPFKPADLVEGVMDMLAGAAYDKGIDLAVCIHPGVPEVLRGDPTRLRQVLANLVSNGIKFTEKGHVALSVAAVETTNEVCRLRFNVADTGIGLSEEGRKRLFQPFSQADGSIARLYGGTGLGLAISRRLVGAMNGDIAVESEEGRGSLFWFTAQFQQADPPAPKESCEAFSGTRVLVAVDDPAVQDALLVYLQACQAKTAVSGRADHIMPQLKGEAAQGQPFTHLIVDLAGPEWNLNAVSQAAWADAELKDLRIIALSAYREQPPADQGQYQGRLDYLAKPVRRERLIDVLRKQTEKPESPVETIPAPGLPALPGSPGKALPCILLAEDNPANLKLATLQLQKLGYRVEQASSGRQAVELLMQASQKYSLVLMDCQMSDVDGFSATRIVRKAELDTSRHIPIVAMTASALPGDREKCLAAGMDDYLTKPIHLEHLSGVINRWLGMSARPVPPPVLEPAPSLPHPLDTAALESIRALQMDGQPDFLTELIDIYLRDSVRHMESIRTSLAEDNLEALRRSSHSLRGASTNMGAHALAAFLNQIEKQAAFGFIEDAADLMANIEDEYRRVIEALEAERREPA